MGLINEFYVINSKLASAINLEISFRSRYCFFSCSRT